jgi:hypothetical protein
MKYSAALIAFCCINLKTAKALGLAALAASQVQSMKSCATGKLSPC